MSTFKAGASRPRRASNAGTSARTDCSNMWTRRLVQVSAASASLSQTVAIGDQDHRRVAMPVAKQVVNHRKELRMRDRNSDKRKRILRDGEKVVARRKMRFTNPQKQSRMIEGVSVAIGHDGIPDYDDLLREALRIALRTDMNPTHDDWDDIYDRIRGLMDAYIHSPEGAGQDACILMTRLAACVADVIPMAVRKRLCSARHAIAILRVGSRE
jgi:hypothetical protein